MTTTQPPSPYQYHYSLHPKIYVAPYTNVPIQTIDGDIDKPIWSQIPWSSNFDDIRGPIDVPNQNERPNSNCTTKFKMTWDDDYLYILALIESDFEVRATFTERNEPIFQQDSDFEVFVDPLGSCHFYKELEVNALNTVWNLMLDKPYWDGGSEHSGRIASLGDDKYYDVCLQKTAVKIIQGSINQEEDEPKRTIWAVEIALSHKDTLKHIMKKCTGSDVVDDDNDETLHYAPKVGDMWRINFSRVEKKGDVNWTWQQQRVWDAKLHKHVGKVDMHLPDIWGYVHFGNNMKDLAGMTNTNDEFVDAGEIPMEDIHNGKGDPLWPIKLTVANVYYAQKQYNEEHGMYASTMDQLKNLLDERVLDPFEESTMKLTTSDNTSYLFQIKDSSSGNVVSITNDRFIRVDKSHDGHLVDMVKEER